MANNVLPDPLNVFNTNSLDYYTEVAKGNIAGASIVNVAARNSSVSSMFADIWGAGSLFSLDYDAQTGNFTAGLVITGGTSGATATIVVDDDSGTAGTLTLRLVSGIFQDGEVIADTSTGSADADGVISSLGIRVNPTGGEQLEIVCESADDDFTGIGARTIAIVYTDSSFAANNVEVVNLDGNTPVLTTATDIFCIQFAACTTYGSATNALTGKSNTGVIVLRETITKNIRGIIDFDVTDPNNEHGLNISQDSHFVIPANTRGFVVNSFINTSKNHEADVRIMIRDTTNEGYISGGQSSIYQNTVVRDTTSSLIAITAGTELKFICRSDNSAVDVNVTYGILLIAD